MENQIVPSSCNAPKWYKFFGCRFPFSNLSLGNICGNWSAENQKTKPDLRLLIDPVAIHWLPLAYDISRFISLARLSTFNGELPTVCDVACGTGLLPYLLAQTNAVRAVGLDPDFDLLLGDGINLENPLLQPQPEEYKHPNLALFLGLADDLPLYLENPPTMVIASFMPQEIDLTVAIASLKPKVIVYIKEKQDHLAGQEEAAYVERFKPKPGYKKALSWQGPSSLDVLRFFAHINFMCDLKPAIAEIPEPRERLVYVHIANEVLDLITSQFNENVLLASYPTLTPYAWETGDLRSVVGSDRYAILARNSKVELAQKALLKLLTVDPVKFEI